MEVKERQKRAKGMIPIASSEKFDQLLKINLLVFVHGKPISQVEAVVQNKKNNILQSISLWGHSKILKDFLKVVKPER